MDKRYHVHQFFVPELIFDLNSWMNITKIANFAKGNIGEFSELKETWISYTERVKQYFIGNRISDDRKVPLLC